MNLQNLLAFGTSEGVEKSWDTRGRGRKDDKVEGVSIRSVLQSFRDEVRQGDRENSADEFYDYVKSNYRPLFVGKGGMDEKAWDHFSDEVAKAYESRGGKK